jgi:hypothetical protein
VLGNGVAGRSVQKSVDKLVELELEQSRFYFHMIILYDLRQTMTALSRKFGASLALRSGHKSDTLSLYWNVNSVVVAAAAAAAAAATAVKTKCYINLAPDRKCIKKCRLHSATY